MKRGYHSFHLWKGYYASRKASFPGFGVLHSSKNHLISSFIVLLLSSRLYCWSRIYTGSAAEILHSVPPYRHICSLEGLQFLSAGRGLPAFAVTASRESHPAPKKFSFYRRYYTTPTHKIQSLFLSDYFLLIFFKKGIDKFCSIG